MVGFVLFCLPAALYLIVQSRGAARILGDARRRLGAVWGPPSGHGLAALLSVPIVLTGWLLGWLRHRTGSFVPGATIRAISNLAVGVIAR